MNEFKLMFNEGAKFEDLLVHEALIPCIKNQDPIIKAILTQDNLKILIQYLTTDKATLPILPYSAMEVLCCQIYFITDLLFGNQTCLIENLLDFLNQKEHYLLAGYFSRVMMAITKRVMNHSNKYNKVGYLKATTNHMYAASTIDYVLKWLSFSTSSGSVVSDYKVVKRQYLQDLIQGVNKQIISDEKAINIAELFKNILNQPYKGNKSAAELFQLILDNNLTRKMLEISDEVGIGKISLIKVLVKRYREAETKKDQRQQQRTLYNLIDVELIQGIFNWIFFCLKTHKKNNSLILNLLQLQQIVQPVNSIRDIIYSYYEQQKQQIITIIIQLMKSKNNLIQLAESKVVLYILKQLKCVSFGRKLLLEGIVHLIDQQLIREHVISWAQTILSYPNQDSSQWNHIQELVSCAKAIQIGAYRFSPQPIQFSYSLERAKVAFASFLSKKTIVQYSQRIKVDIKKTLSSPQEIQSELKLQIKKKNSSYQPSCHNLENKKQNEIFYQDILIDEIQLLNNGIITTMYLSYDIDQLMSQL